MRHWRFDPPEAGVRAKADCAAEVRRGSCGWLVRAEAGEDLRLVSSHRDPDRTLHEVSADFPADPEAPAEAFRLVWLPAPFAGSNRVVRLASRGGARVSDAMFAAAAIVACGAALGVTKTVYDPAIIPPRATPLTAAAGVAYLLFCIMPLALDVYTEYSFSGARKRSFKA